MLVSFFDVHRVKGAIILMQVETGRAPLPPPAGGTCVLQASGF